MKQNVVEKHESPTHMETAVTRLHPAGVRHPNPKSEKVSTPLTRRAVNYTTADLCEHVEALIIMLKHVICVSVPLLNQRGV